MSFIKKISTLSGTSFLPERLVMVDCEMEGVVPKRDALLQIASLKLQLEGNQYREVGEPLVIYLAHKGKPYNDFHWKYLKKIFYKCNKSKITPGIAKEKLHEWLGDWKGQVSPVGDCVPTDIAFLLEKGCADPSDIGNPGTFHYEFFEMNALKLVARHLVGSKFETPGVDKKGVHDALVDCRNQLCELNECLKIILDRGAT